MGNNNSTDARFYFYDFIPEDEKNEVKGNLTRLAHDLPVCEDGTLCVHWKHFCKLKNGKSVRVLYEYTNGGFQELRTHFQNELAKRFTNGFVLVNSYTIDSRTWWTMYPVIKK